MRDAMRKIMGLILGLSVILTQIPSVDAQEIPETLHERITTEQIAKGLVYEHRQKLTAEGWVDIHVMKMDMTEETLTLDIVRDQEVFAKRDGLSDMANQSGEFAGAVNGSFFSVGNDVSDVDGSEITEQGFDFAKDQYNTGENRAASLISQSDGSVMFDFVSSEINFVTSKGVDIYVVGINSIGNFSNPVVFNRKAYEDTSSIDAMVGLYKVVVENDEIIALIPPGETAVIPEAGYVLVMNESLGSSVIRKLSVGQGAQLTVTTNVDVENIDMAISGGGMILKDGEMVSEGLIVGENSRHPRTAVGITEEGDTLISMVVDGRGESIGATHEELAAYLLEYDVSNAIHFDGGGSSTMSARELGEFELDSMNTPSDGYERPIVNGLGFVSTAPKTSEYQLYLAASQTRSFINSQIQLELKAYDMNYNPVEVDQSKVAWGMSGGYGLIDGMTFIPKASGQVMLTAYYQGRKTTISIDVSDELIDLEVIPKVISFDDGEQTFMVIGTDEKGYKSVIDNNLLTWELSQPVGTIENGVFVGTNGIKDARVDVTYKGIKEVAYIVSGDKTSTLLDLGTTEVETFVYPETVVGESKVVSKKDTQYLTIDYNFVASDISQSVSAVLPETVIHTPVDQIRMAIDEYPEGVIIKAFIMDSTGYEVRLPFEEKTDGIVEVNVPPNYKYPLYVKQLYVVSTGTETDLTGTVNIRDVVTVIKKTEKDLDEVISIKPVDPLIDLFPEEGFDLTIFGATAGRNRLLDEVVLDKVYNELNQADYAIYAGRTNVNENEITNDHLLYDNTFAAVDLEHARIISLAMGNGGIVSTDPSQWQQFSDAIASTPQNTIVIVGTEKLIGNSDSGFSKEGALIHEILREFCKKSGKTVFYVNASGYKSGLEYYEGVRYIDLNGLWYKVTEDHEVDLYDSFQTLKLTFAKDEVSYRLIDLYPKTTVQK